MASEPALGLAFATAAGSGADAPWLASVDALLRARWDDARARWTSVELPASSFAEHLGALVRDDASPAEAVAKLQTTDLYLTFACARADPAALRELDREYLHTLGAMLSRLNPPSTVVEEVAQHLRDRLLVARGDRPPGIVKYTGRGSLAGWIKVVAMREAMARLRKRRPSDADDEEEVSKISAPGHDPEFDLMRQRYGDAFRESFGAAVRGLPARDREVLRGHLVERLSIDQLGALHDVHRATAARWLVTIRQRLYDGTRDELTRRLDISADEYESILRIIGSQLNVTVGGKLG